MAAMPSEEKKSKKHKDDKEKKHKEKSDKKHKSKKHKSRKKSRTFTPPPSDNWGEQHDRNRDLQRPCQTLHTPYLYFTIGAAPPDAFSYPRDAAWLSAAIGTLEANAFAPFEALPARL